MQPLLLIREQKSSRNPVILQVNRRDVYKTKKGTYPRAPAQTFARALERAFIMLTGEKRKNKYSIMNRK